MCKATVAPQAVPAKHTCVTLLYCFGLTVFLPSLVTIVSVWAAFLPYASLFTCTESPDSSLRTITKDSRISIDDLQAGGVPFLLKGAFTHWAERKVQPLSLLSKWHGDLEVALFLRPPEQSPQDEPKLLTNLSSFATWLQQLPSGKTPHVPLYLAEVPLANGRISKSDNMTKPDVSCPFLEGIKNPGVHFGMNRERDGTCSQVVGSLLDDFSWVNPLVGHSVTEVEANLWAGSAGTRTGLHADVEPFSLLVMLQGRKRVTFWPPSLSDELMPSGRFDAGARVSEIDTFDPQAETKYPSFARVRDRNVSLILSPGDALHLPSGWWHVVENLETSVAISFHLWRGDWQEMLAWMPHGFLDILHHWGIYRPNWCTCHRPSIAFPGALSDLVDRRALIPAGRAEV